jgi:hypothetical protein
MGTLRVVSLASIAVGLLMAPLAWAADNAVVVGKWTLTSEMRGQQVESTLEITETDGTLAGSYTSQRGTDQLADVQWDGTKLTFKRNLDLGGNAITLEYSATVTADAMEGTVTSPRGDSPFSGKR